MSAKSWLNAWAASRRMHDARAMPCAFGCAGGNGEPAFDDMRGAKLCGPPQGNGAGASAIDWMVGIGVAAMLASAFVLWLVCFSPTVCIMR